MKKLFTLVLAVALLPGCYVGNLTMNMDDVNASAEIGRGAKVNTEVNTGISTSPSASPSVAPVTVIGTPGTTEPLIIDPGAWVRKKFVPGDTVKGLRRGWNIEYDPGTGRIISAALPGNANSAHYLVNPVVPVDLIETIHLNKYMVSRQLIVFNMSGE